MPCPLAHHDPNNWLDELMPDGKRLRTICRHCKKFIGFRPRPKDDHTKHFSQRPTYEP